MLICGLVCLIKTRIQKLQRKSLKSDLLISMLFISYFKHVCISTYFSCIDEKRKKEEYIREMNAADSFSNTNLKEEDEREVQDLKIFSFGLILAATNNFSSDNKLGEGGFGPVYKVHFHCVTYVPQKFLL